MSRAEITIVKDGKIFVSTISPPIDDRDIMIELHRYEGTNRPMRVRAMILSREEFRELLADWTRFDKDLKR